MKSNPNQWPSEGSHTPVYCALNSSRELYAKVKKDDDDFFSLKEAQLFLTIAELHELYELFFVTLFFGLRREEVLGLRWSSVDFDGVAFFMNVSLFVYFLEPNLPKTPLNI